ncbi:MAG TPA: putative quinol monooxygenase [Accumulibacter sp.]|uniref:putative quinol monooxygenase n=1 Tax=Accumulibacter sp. TaxID=2053492 RepID=UPI002BC13734|nr:putative quinol monooxygenase [Accumulibacter sp.]HNH91704.1 putative quinol monooxygenase [Accumulibacter sp.]HNL95642.1 putative quinol monooxygenase [Accumulibacter sp.]HNM63906.1 putative quinol monooxygenase [Accumulibacter sp.]
MIRIMARIKARAGQEAALRSLLRELCTPSRNESGCLSYELFENDDDPLEFVTVEQWRDQAAADAHLASAHVAAAIALASELLAQAPLIHRFRAIA